MKSSVTNLVMALGLVAISVTPRHWPAGIGQHWNDLCLLYAADRK